jgi:tetratricopeptide (TPR) repeat protein
VAALVEMRRKFYPDSISLANALYDQARLELAMGQFAQAEQTMNGALTMQRSALGTARRPMTDNRIRLLHAQMLVSTGRARLAVDELQAVLANEAPAGVTLALDHLAARNGLAVAYLDLRDPARARDEASAALRDLRASAVRGFYQRLEADAELRFGQAQLQLGNADAALPALEHALALRAANVDKNSPAIEEAELALADCLAALKQLQRAQLLRAQAGAVRATHAKLGVRLPQPLLR